MNQEEFVSDAPNPVSLRQILGHDVDREELLQKILDAFAGYYELLRRADYMDVSGIYHQSLYRRKGYHWYEDKDGEFEGAIVEVEDDGHLILHDKQGHIRSYSLAKSRSSCKQGKRLFLSTQNEKTLLIKIFNEYGKI